MGADGQGSGPGLREAAAEAVRGALEEAGVDWERPEPFAFVAVLPGTRKLTTNVSLRLGEHSLSVNAFVVRRPDENHEAFYRWLLERNTRARGLAYALDPLGDVYAVGRLPLAAVDAEAVDQLLGAVLEAADEPFNHLLELGFATAIRREWAWRTKRGESTRNLEAFTRLRGEAPDPSS